MTTGKYLLEISNPHKLLAIKKKTEELGQKKDSDVEKFVENKCS